jgi:dihydrofolate reductase
MRKVITGAFVSLDGVMQAPGGPEEDPTRGFKFGGWVVPYADEVFGQAVDKMFGQPFDLLLGRKTYEIFAAHWPYAEGGDDRSIAKLFNNTTKYVATRSTMELTWTGSLALHDAAADVARLKREDGPALVTQGSSDLIQTLLANDLIDEIKYVHVPNRAGQRQEPVRQGGEAGSVQARGQQGDDDGGRDRLLPACG